MKNELSNSQRIDNKKSMRRLNIASIDETIPVLEERTELIQALVSEETAMKARAKRKKLKMKWTDIFESLLSAWASVDYKK